MRASRIPAVLIALTLAASCSVAKEDGGRERGTPQVGFIVVRPQAVPVPISLGGRTVAFETSEVRPQVNGIIRRRNFVEGSTVRRGQPLFQIDPSLYRASVNQAQANLAAARASAEAAEARAARFRPLAEMEAVSRQEYTDALAQARQGRAAVAQNAAALDTARINLGFTEVPAPITGRIGRSLFTVGALVDASQTEPLAVIQRIDPIYVDMQQSSAELVTLKRNLAAGGNRSPGSMVVRMKLEDGSAYPYPGTVQFSEVTVSEETGTVTLRARFANPEGLLLPGMFVQATFDQAVDRGAFLVPQQALDRDVAGQAHVLVVGADNKVVQRAVQTTRTFGASWVVTGGLKAGDKVITQGTAGIKPGMPVKPVPARSPQRVVRPQPGQAGAPGKGG